jgi:hypothetical protein
VLAAVYCGMLHGKLVRLGGLLDWSDRCVTTVAGVSIQPGVMLPATSLSLYSVILAVINAICQKVAECS